MDLWRISTETGQLRQLTDDAAEDWDPGFTPDGKSLLWSSNRSGAFEIWTADVDGSGARPVTKFGLDAENPTETPDGRWIVYLQGTGPRPGIWKVRPDGTDAQFLTSPGGIPEVSPDGAHIAFGMNPTSAGAVVRTIRTEDGKLDDFRVDLPQGGLSLARIVIGRCRWMPDGRSVVVLTRDAKGFRVDAYPFTPGAHSLSASPLVPAFDPSVEFETFGVSPDGKRITVAGVAKSKSLMVAERVPDIHRPKR
jgi:dipeptidyl aminopeptidase/acylaminoacyl peptidase